MTAESNSLYPLQRQVAFRAVWVTVWAAWKAALGGFCAKKSRSAGNRLGGVQKAISYQFDVEQPIGSGRFHRRGFDGGAARVPATNLAIASSGPASFRLSGQGGANQPYGIYAQTNITAAMSNWWLLGMSNSDGSGLIQFLDTKATNDRRFYRFGQ